MRPSGALRAQRNENSTHRHCTSFGERARVRMGKSPRRHGGGSDIDLLIDPAAETTRMITGQQIEHELSARASFEDVFSSHDVPFLKMK